MFEFLVSTTAAIILAVAFGVTIMAVKLLGWRRVNSDGKIWYANALDREQIRRSNVALGVFVGAVVLGLVATIAFNNGDDAKLWILVGGTGIVCFWVGSKWVETQVIYKRILADRLRRDHGMDLLWKTGDLRDYLSTRSREQLIDHVVELRNHLVDSADMDGAAVAREYFSSGEKENPFN